MNVLSLSPTSRFTQSVLTAAGAAALLAACAAPARVEVPATLAPAANEVHALTVAARGVQIYECRAKAGTTTEAAWVFVAPEAELFDARGRAVGRHGAGPHWQASDGSRVEGTLKARAAAPAADAVPWLLLSTRDTGSKGAFSGVTSIQRVNTVGGTAPANACSVATAGATARVPYTADYYFFSAR
ncbi:MAG TPA: DUF3455 domain-containing protein [Burkholderiaceae bacterium]|nr:DUF3455 domain-containing protein [Burkholderiaceae bacterium]